jgi:hypothetical protein
MAAHKATKRLHLITNGKERDVSLGMAEGSDPESSEVICTPLADSRPSHPSNTDGPTAS